MKDGQLTLPRDFEGGSLRKRSADWMCSEGGESVVPLASRLSMSLKGVQVAGSKGEIIGSYSPKRSFTFGSSKPKGSPGPDLDETIDFSTIAIDSPATKRSKRLAVNHKHLLEAQRHIFPPDLDDTQIIPAIIPKCSPKALTFDSDPLEPIADPSLQFPELKDQFIVNEKISHGAFSSVYKATRKEDGKLVAIKRLHPIVSPDRTLCEIMALHLLPAHPHVCSLLGGVYSGSRVSLVLPLMEHEEFKLTFRAMGLSDVKQYCRALFSSLAHIHKFGIIHRDIKPSNFIHKRGTNQYMLIDFGLIDTVPKGSPVKTSKLSKILQESRQRSKTLPGAPRAGTRGFRAPEVLLRLQEQTTAIDVWSAGIILLSIACGRHPLTYPKDDIESLIFISELVGSDQLQSAAKSIGRSLRLPKRHEFRGWRRIVKKLRLAEDQREWSDQMYKFLHRCLDPNPFMRITAEQALLHPFLSEDF